MKFKRMSKRFKEMNLFWRIVVVCLLISFPWTILIIIGVYWSLDDKLCDIEEKIDKINKEEEE